MNKKVSIIIPVYNASDYLAKNIDSVLTQDYENIELILVDDGSIDKSAEIIKEYEKRDYRVVGLFQDNSGAPTARNYGLTMANGDYIQFIDSDDYLAEGALKMMVNALESSNADIVIGAYDTVDQEGKFIKKVTMPFPGSTYNLKDKRTAFSVIPPMPGNKLFRASVINDNHLQFEASLKQAQDLNFYLKALLYIENVVVLDEVTYHYRVRSGSISHTYSLVILEVIRSINNAREFYETNECLNEALFANIKFHHYNFQIQKIPQIIGHSNRKKAIRAFKEEFKSINKADLIHQYRGKKYWIVKSKLALDSLYISELYTAYQAKKAKNNKIS